MELSFHRGTLLIQASPAEVAGLQGQEILRDEHARAWRAPAFRYSAIVAAANKAGVRLSDDVRIPDDGPDMRAPALRSYQDAALTAWELGGRRGVLALPTGSGKTRVALAAIARARVPALVLVPTRVLLQQWHEALRGVVGERVGVVGDGERRIEPITVCTNASAYASLDDFGDRFRLLVADEVHHFAGGRQSEALEMSVAPWRLGLTATLPEAPDGRARLEELVGPLLFELNVGDLSGTHLAPLDRVRLPVELTAEERQRYSAAYDPFLRALRLFHESHPGAGWAEFVRVASKSDAGRAALRGWREARALLALSEAKRTTLAALLQRHREERSLIFTADNESAYAVSRELLVPALTCDIGRSERTLVLQRFREGTLRTLVSSRVLNEGIDVPDAAIGVVLGGALGSGEHAQRAGRILRPAQGKRATLYELVVKDSLEWNQSTRRQVRLVARAAVTR